MHCLHQSVVTHLSIFGRLVRVLGGSGFLHCLLVMVWVAGCHNGLLLWLCGHSELYRWLLQVYCCGGGVSFVVLVCEEGVWLLWCNWEILNREKTTIKSVMMWLAMGGRKKEV
jgi:hypothetical protein